jgi:hypothetical protein
MISTEIVLQLLGESHDFVNVMDVMEHCEALGWGCMEMEACELASYRLTSCTYLVRRLIKVYSHVHSTSLVRRAAGAMLCLFIACL